MQITVWTVTTEGDNSPVETAVFASEDGARAYAIECIESYHVQRTPDGHRLEAASLAELSDAYESAADGAMIIEEHTIEVVPCDAADLADERAKLAMLERNKAPARMIDTQRRIVDEVEASVKRGRP